MEIQEFYKDGEPLSKEHAKEHADKTRQALTVLRGEVSIDQITCEECYSNAGCEYAFDMYNTNGDCLAEK